MCGIAGFVGPGNKQDLQAMGAALRHRGPDGEGVFIAAHEGVHLIHRRLAIVDIAGGDQPMWNEDGSVGVIFNGEIYNHLELRRELISAGHTFRSDHSDTEVLVHGYEEWGSGLAVRLNGMFAFAIYDANRQCIFLARDRLGKKPLYYACSAGLFCFASELSALLVHPAMRPRIAPHSVQKLFAYGFIPGDSSLYEGVRRLPGGHHMTFDLQTPGKVTMDRYWAFQIEEPDRIPHNAERQWIEELRHLLSRAVQRRLMSDVPLGIFLSGGIDSTCVLAFAAQHLPKEQIHTFSIGFHEASFDESTYARAIAAHFGSTHHEEILDLDLARRLVPTVLGKLDEPFADPSIIPTHLLCAFARHDITVALGGDGGDEVFAGYDPFKALAVAGWFHRLCPAWAKTAIRGVADLLPVSSANMSWDFKIKRGLRGACFPPELWNPVWLGPLEPDEVAELFEEPLSTEQLYEEAIASWRTSPSRNVVDRTLEFYTNFYLQGDILPKADRASMMSSLEVRSPLLDYDVIEFARKLPHEYKFRGGDTKYLLKRALRGLIPDSVLDRKKKGFGIPLTSWLRQWPAEDFRTDRWQFMKPAWVSSRLREHQSGRRDHRLLLWTVLALNKHIGQHRQD